MSQSADIADTVSPHGEPEVPRAEVATAEGTVAHSTATPSTTHDKEVPDFFTPGHIVQIPLRTLQDITRARNWTQSVSSQTRPVLSDLKFSFRSMYDGADDITTIRVVRVTHRPGLRADPEIELTTCLGLYTQDHAVPARVTNMYNEVAREGGIWTARLWKDESESLRVGGPVWRMFYSFFRDLAIRKEGNEWDGANLRSVVELLAELRGR